MATDISEHMWVEEADDGGAFLVFSDELCDALGVEEGHTCEIEVISRNGDVEILIEPEEADLSEEQLSALASDSVQGSL